MPKFCATLVQTPDLMKIQLFFSLLLFLFSCKDPVITNEPVKLQQEDSLIAEHTDHSEAPDTSALFARFSNAFKERESAILAEKKDFLILKFVATNTYDIHSITRYYQKDFLPIYHFSDEGYEGGGAVQHKILFNADSIAFVYAYTLDMEEQYSYWSAKEQTEAGLRISFNSDSTYTLQQSACQADESAMLNAIFQLEARLFKPNKGKYVYNDMKTTNSEYGEIETGIVCEMDSLLFEQLKSKMK